MVIKNDSMMRRIRSSKVGGFTLIEVLMAVLLIAILATIAISQFTNFARDTRNAATRENLGILRSAIQKHFGTMRIRCGTLTSAYPPLAALNNNDITDSGTVCTTTQVPETSDRYFVSGGIPENPWSDAACTVADRKNVVAAAGGSNMVVGFNATTLVDAGATAGTQNCGWIYNVTTGLIKANSENNTGGSNAAESSY